MAAHAPSMVSRRTWERGDTLSAKPLSKPSLPADPRESTSAELPNHGTCVRQGRADPTAWRHRSVALPRTARPPTDALARLDGECVARPLLRTPETRTRGLDA